jgi:PTS system nitrogen regulatory IIA component
VQLTVQQAAALLQVEEGQVRRWIRDRGLPAVLFNEQYRLNRIDLLVWAHEHQIPVPAQALAAGEPEHVSLPAALARGGIHRGLASGSRSEALAALLQRLSLPPRVDRELLLEMLLAREAQGTTAVGHGIVIPHARYPVVAGVAEPLLALGFPQTPVDFGANAGPVTALFLLLAPDHRTHLHLLARLARALQSDLQAKVTAQATDAEILAAAGRGRGAPQP